MRRAAIATARGRRGARRHAGVAERLIVSVSNHRVSVTPYYSGEELVLFGAVEKDADTPANRTSYDIVVTVTGPRTNMVTRRKERKFGIWVNVDSRQFQNVPGYLAIFANRAFDAIASPEVQRRPQVGLEQHAADAARRARLCRRGADDPFRTAFVRLDASTGSIARKPRR